MLPNAVHGLGKLEGSKEGGLGLTNNMSLEAQAKLCDKEKGWKCHSFCETHL